MFKLFRFTSAAFRLYELKHGSNARLLYQVVLNPANQLNLSHRNKWGCKSYSTKDENELSNKSGEL